jgi:predicted nucleic acid-binding protein
VVTAESRGRVLVDSDVVIDHIRGARPLPDFPLAFSAITRCELFAGRDDPRYLRKLLAPMHEIPLDMSIAERGGVLKRTVQLQTPDAIIAATALEHELALMTRNRRHFDRVPGLTLCSPRNPAKPTDDVEQPAS